MTARNPGSEKRAKGACFLPQGFRATTFFSRGFLLRYTRRTKRKRDYLKSIENIIPGVNLAQNCVLYFMLTSDKRPKY